VSHYSDSIKHCDTFAEWKDCDKHKDLECYRLECAVCDWTERDCEEEKVVELKTQDYCGDCGQVEWLCICHPYCGDHLVPLGQCSCKP